MSVNKLAQDTLEAARPALPPSPPVDHFEAEDYIDSSGEQSIRVLVVLTEATDPEKVSGEDVGELKYAIRKRLADQGITAFPYIFFAKPSELAEDEDADL